MGAFAKAFSRDSGGGRMPTIRDVTISKFDGGLKVTDNEFALTLKDFSDLTNMLIDDDGSFYTRFGTKEFAQLADDVVNLVYFNGYLICVLSNGTIEAVDDAGTNTVIWNTAIAAALPGAPSGWSTGLTSADFTEFRGNLVVVNGVDKPLLISGALVVTYLQDIPTGSNVNTPIAKFVTTVSNYCVMAGVSGAPEEIYISTTGASGTWPGDPAPNDAISFNVGAYAGEASSTIRALGVFRNFLLVFFDNLSIAIQLGTFDSTPVHTPIVVDTYPNLGTISPKTVIITEKDALFTSRVGLFSASKTVFGDTLESTLISENLGDDYPEVLGQVMSACACSYAANDTLSRTLFMSFKDQNNGNVTTWAMRYGDNFRKVRWARITGWAFTAACTTERGRVFFAQGDKIYQYGNSVFADENYTTDYIALAASEGIAIPFIAEFPWTGAGNRLKNKRMRSVGFDTIGSNTFSLQSFVNNRKFDTDGNLVPVTDMEFIGAGAPGYGNVGYGSGGYGGSRRSDDQRFFALNFKFKTVKLRIYGNSTTSLRFGTMALIYSQGNYSAA